MELRSWEADPAPAHAPLALAWAAFAALAEQMTPAEGATTTSLCTHRFCDVLMNLYQVSRALRAPMARWSSHAHVHPPTTLLLHGHLM